MKTTVFRKDDPYVFATGARDGKILIWDIRIPQKTVLKPDNAVCNCHAFNTPLSKRNNKNITNNRSNTITGLVFQNDATLISCGAGDGSIKVWDLRKNYSAYKKDPLPKHSIPYCGSSSKSGYANLLLDDAGIRLYANCMDSVIYCFNVSTYSVVPEQRYIGHENNSFYIKSSLSSDSNYLVSGSSNEKAYIWNVQYSEPIVSLNGHVAEVTCASWCQNGDLKIVTCGDDSRYNIWRIGKEFPDANDAIEIHGKAETVTSFEKQGKSPWGILEKTPQSSRSKYATSSHSSSRKIRINTPSNSDYYYGTSVTKRTSKRSLFNIENIKEVEEGEPSKIFKCDSSKENNWNTANLIPTSQNVNDMCCTPKKIVIDNVLDSPTANLPNFNINGEAPHQRLMSPLKNTVSNVDWLTKIRQSKLSSSEKNPANSDMKQRNSTSKQTPDVNKTPGRHKSKPTLLDYFSPNRKPETN